MNVRYPYSWIKEFLKTNISAEEFAKEMSLCSSSVEKTTLINGDFVFDVEITSNRSDLIGVLGFAREAYAVTKRFGHKSFFQSKDYFLKTKPKISGCLEISIEIDKRLCPKYLVIALDGIAVKESPKLMQDRLEKYGIRSLNNVVDITNYIMAEFGQPMHAFDLDSIGKDSKNRTIMHLRESKEGEKIVTLDGNERNIPTGSIVIDDNAEIYDLAGIMGGKSSEITEKTKRAILFAQIYDKKTIRRTSLLLNHRTLAAQIFEKGVDPDTTEKAFYKALYLCQKYANAKVASPIYERDNIKIPSRKIVTSIGKLTDYLGKSVVQKDVINTLNNLKIKTKRLNNKEIISEVPSFRYQDLSLEEDIIEEYARIQGYFDLKPSLPKCDSQIRSVDQRFEIEKKIRNILTSSGFTEIYTYSMVPEIQDSNTPFLKIKNPLTEDKSYLRNRSLIPSLTEVVNNNKGRFDEIKIFEISNIYNPKENLMLSLVLYSTKTAILKSFRVLKGIAKDVCNLLDIPLITNASLTKDTAFVEIDLSSLNDSKIQAPTYKSIDDNTPIKEMVSFINSGNKSFEEIETLLTSTKLPNDIIFTFELVDCFENSQTYKILYTKKGVQLSNTDVKESRDLIIKQLETYLGAKVRRQEN
jgi:phenylalanyl-tRNA synthetase beta chain